MQTDSLIIKEALVHDGLGSVFTECDVYIENGKIIDMGENLPQHAKRTIDSSGLELFPGFIAALSPWGGAGPSLYDNNLSENSAMITPQMDVTYAFQPDSITFQQLYNWGITATCLTPEFNNLFGGLAAVYKTHGSQYGDFLLRSQVFLAASISDAVKSTHAGKRYAQTDMGLLHLLAETLEAVLATEEHKTLVNQIIAEVLGGHLPLVLCCDSRSKWQRAKDIIARYPKTRLVLTGLYDVSLSDLTMEDKMLPCILFSIADANYHSMDSVNYEGLNDSMNNEAVVAASPYLAESAMSHAEAVLWNAANLYRNGVPSERIVQMLCGYPAQILGVEDRIGSIRPGQDADFSLWSGNPIKTFSAQMKHVFINGAEVTTKEAARFCW